MVEKYEKHNWYIKVRHKKSYLAYNFLTKELTLDVIVRGIYSQVIINGFQRWIKSWRSQIWRWSLDVTRWLVTLDTEDKLSTHDTINDLVDGHYMKNWWNSSTIKSQIFLLGLNIENSKCMHCKIIFWASLLLILSSNQIVSLNIQLTVYTLTVQPRFSNSSLDTLLQSNKKTHKT
jgi:hypothetical protein